MLLDMHSLTPFNNAGGIADGEVPVFDMAGITIKHLKVVVISSLIAALRYVQDNHCLRLKHIHVINCSPIIERIMNLVKPLLKKDIFDMVMIGLLYRLFYFHYVILIFRFTFMYQTLKLWNRLLRRIYFQMSVEERLAQLKKLKRIGLKKLLKIGL